MKLEATRGYGAEVVLYDKRKESREALGRRIADERGLTLIRRSTIRTSLRDKAPRQRS